MDNEQSNVDTENNEEPLLLETDDTEEPKEEPKEKREYTTEEKLARVTRLQQRYQKELGIEPTVIKVESAEKSKGTTGESDVEALLLEVKGIVEPEETALFEKWKSDTGRPARDILKNEIFQKELQTIKTALEVKKATPSSTKRSGGGESNDLALALAKAEQTGQLPDDFELKSKVINTLVERENTNKPAWH